MTIKLRNKRGAKCASFYLSQRKSPASAGPRPGRSKTQRYTNWRVLDTLAATFATRAPKKATVMRAKKAVNMFGSVEWVALRSMEPL